MTRPDLLEQAVAEAERNQGTELATASQRARESGSRPVAAGLFELQKTPFRMRFLYDPGASFEQAITDARISFVDPAIDFTFERPSGGPVTLDVTSRQGIRATMSGVAALLNERGQRRCTQEELLGIAAALRNVQGSFLIGSGIFYAEADGKGLYNANYVLVLVIDGDDRSLTKMRWEEFIDRPGHILAVVNNTVPRPSELRARSGSMP